MMSVEDRVDALVQVHRLPCSNRKILQHRHIREEFSVDDSLFYRFARVVCDADRIPRKELFEAWAMALKVHEHFPNIVRFADLACGHGLVSWALLILYHHEAFSSGKGSSRVSAVCIDINMPIAAEQLQHSMVKEFPELMGYWNYVEASIHGIVPSPDCLLVGVHACSALSDIIISNAIYGNSPMALVPCCHSKGCLTGSQKEFFSGQGPDFMNLAAYLDGLRVERLEMAGFQVSEAFIHEAITPKNRLIVARPISKSDDPPPVIRLEPSKIHCGFSIPLDDSATSKREINTLSGKEASRIRKAPPPVSFGLVLSLPSSEGITLEPIQQLVNELNLDGDVHAVKELAYHDPATDLYYQTFRVTYQKDFIKEDAKVKHILLCHAIESKLAPIGVKQIPRLLTTKDLEIFLPIGPSKESPFLEVSDEDVHKTALNILPIDAANDLTIKRVGGKSTFFRRKSGRHSRLFKLRYCNLTQSVADEYHEKLRAALPAMIPGLALP